ncbi:MAG: hypothetical protein ACFNTM_00240 [Cardiobacterium sp.]|jgi:hypothetical protein|uniref:Ribbon-helix-helix protein CopG domain-containing protein n=2 Tax=Cardiobacterium TaxID=2717 RepID=A0A381EBZ9_9GAMM|nr:MULTISPECIES: hypothetical protein [Cardiobacterium]EEV87765.1 hypothetical protein HMPREF0198_2159 [Cardiobacterium hominis ATCC 15826]SUX24516.1 Uncharacterised protein [Cardiobacterium valvarum]VEG77544.1 Uncharacterised protein [Cardiobacterium hominis]DAK45603.1 MAG TPA: hypothetical protein [Caudoviricetes sp.]
MNIKPPETRKDKPVLVRLSQQDRQRLQRAARKLKLPMATIAYQCVKQYLDAEFGKGGQS